MDIASTPGNWRWNGLPLLQHWSFIQSFSLALYLPLSLSLSPCFFFVCSTNNHTDKYLELVGLWECILHSYLYNPSLSLSLSSFSLSLALPPRWWWRLPDEYVDDLVTMLATRNTLPSNRELDRKRTFWKQKLTYAKLSIEHPKSAIGALPNPEFILLYQKDPIEMQCIK